MNVEPTAVQPGNGNGGIEDKLEIEATPNVFRNISHRLRRMTSIASVSDHNERKEIEHNVNEHALFVSPGMYASHK